jgi:hypothetical protein
VGQLAALRVITGIAIGGILASISVITAAGGAGDPVR